MTSETANHVDLPAIKRALSEAVHNLVGRTTTYLDRDEGTTEPNIVWGDSKYQQLVDYMSGAQGTRNGNTARSMPPVVLDAVALVDTIDRTVREWQPTAGTGPALDETVRRLHLIVDYPWTPDDTAPMEAMTAKLQVWVARIDNLLDPPARWTISAACPSCGESTVYREDSAGEQVRSPALSIDTGGCECQACHMIWDPSYFAHLARTLGVLPENVLE